MNNKEKSCPSVGINWYPRTHGKNYETSGSGFKTSRYNYRNTRC